MNQNGQSNGHSNNGVTSTFAAKVGLAEMLKGGVIMDVANVEQARIAEAAGATVRSWRWNACPRTSANSAASRA